MAKNKTVFGICLLAAAIPVFSQAPNRPNKPSFEVVSIKPSAPGSSFGGGGVDGDRYVMHGATLKVLIQIAYRTSSDVLFRADQVLGGPAFIDSDRFDVEAKMGCRGGAISDEQIQLMAQSMLEDRFQLRAHYEKRDLPVYDLVVAKGGPKLKRAQDQTPAVRPPELTTPLPCAPPSADKPAVAPVINSHAIPRGFLLVMKNASVVTMTGTAVPVSQLVGMLQGQAGRLVIDKTGLKGLFDIDLKFTPPSTTSAASATAGADVPELFTAIQDQLGLKLESAKSPLDVLVIDSVQRPAEN